MLYTAAKQVIREDAIEEYEKLVKELVEITRTEEGNVSYNITRSVDDPRTYCFFEVWESMELMMKHLQGETFQRIGPQLDAMVEEGFGLDIYEAF